MPLIVHRMGGMKTGHQEKPPRHSAPKGTPSEPSNDGAEQSRRAAPPPTGEPPGDAGVTRARIPIAPPVRRRHASGPDHALGNRTTPRSRSDRPECDPFP